MDMRHNDIFGIRRSTILIISVALAIGSFSTWKALGGRTTEVAGTLRVPSALVVAGLPTEPHSSTVRSPAAHTTASLGSAILTKADAVAAGRASSVVAGLPTEPHATVKTTLTPIEQIQVGDRVLAESPTGEEDTAFGSEIIPADWRKLTLRAPKRDGTVAEVVLLRPLTWLNEQHGEVGGTVFISVPECGIDGNAQVLAIDPCPEIRPGGGRVVTGTFLHQARSTITLTIAGQSEPIECTGNHPFWSEDRQAFVRADSLHPNETLRTSTGLTTVESWTPDLNPTPVYNIEVHGAHVYHVGISGVVVHNPSGLSIANPCLYPEIPELGLGFTGNLDRFKKQFPGILDYDDLGLNPYSKFFPKQLESLMDGAGVIRFDVSGMRGLTGPDGVLTGPAFLNSLGSTNWELRTIFDNPALRAKTLIYNNGVPSSFEELLRMR